MTEHAGVTGRRLVSHSAAAAILGVSTRTVDRWVAAGLLSKPMIIRHRKYYEAAAIESVGRDLVRVA